MAARGEGAAATPQNSWHLKHLSSPRAETCMLILWDPVNGPHTTDRAPRTATLRHPGNQCRSNRVGHPPGCRSTTVPPHANQAHRQDRGPSTAHASSPPRGSRGERSPKTAHPPVDMRLRDPAQPGADGYAREDPRRTTPAREDLGCLYRPVFTASTKR